MAEKPRATSEKSALMVELLNHVRIRPDGTLGISRRGFLVVSALVALGVPLASIFAACAPGNPNTAVQTGPLPPARVDIVYPTPMINPEYLARGTQLSFGITISDARGTRTPGFDIAFTHLAGHPIPYNKAGGEALLRYFGTYHDLRVFDSKMLLNDGLGLRLLFGKDVAGGLHKEGEFINIANQGDAYMAMIDIYSLLAAQAELNVNGRSLYDTDMTDSEILDASRPHRNMGLLFTDIMAGQRYADYRAHADAMGLGISLVDGENKYQIMANYFYSEGLSPLLLLEEQAQP